MNKRKTCKRIETSKVYAAACLLLGGGSVAAYWTAVFLGKPCDSAVAVQAMVTVVGALLSYCLYQFGLKNSRNRYKVDADGNPFPTDQKEEPKC